MNIVKTLKDKWWIFALVLIFLYSYYIRAFNIIPDRLLSFDPIFQYRYTYYIANFGHLPAWDELTYYVGRLIEINTSPPLFLYITAVIYWLIKSFSLSLMTVTAYMSAIYGAMIVIPAFLLGKELSNKYGGLFSAVLAGAAPQIMSRTFGSSYDNDQFVLLFLVLTLYLGYYALKKKTLFGYSLALLGFAGFLMTWGYSFYSYFILVGFVIIYFILNSLIGKEGFKRSKLEENLMHSLSDTKDAIILMVALFIGLAIFASINKESILLHVMNILSFATQAEVWIVNVSIAELQQFNVFSIAGWITTMGGFATGNAIIDTTILLIFTLFIILGFVINYKKKNVRVLSFLITLLLIGIYTTSSGIRFSEETSAFFIILIAVGFGSLVELIGNRDALYRAAVIGLGIFLALNVMQMGYAIGKQVGPDINSNWDNAWNFLKNNTPELSIVGTWWDPGHMIAGLADRRDFADGAHCHNQCLYTINDRIADLGKIMATTDENVSLNLIKKYQGDSPNVYWIASDDLIGKYQWLQYFGTGCDARIDQSCPLYIQIPQQSQSADSSGNIVLRNYGGIEVFQGFNVPIPIYVNNINGALFDEVLYYSNNSVVNFKPNDTEKQVLIQAMKPLESQLSFRFSNQTVPMTVWVSQDYSYIVIIPPTLRNTVFTKMFMLSGQGLNCFKLVFSNDQVRIFEVNTECKA